MLIKTYSFYKKLIYLSLQVINNPKNENTNLYISFLLFN